MNEIRFVDYTDVCDYLLEQHNHDKDVVLIADYEKTIFMLDYFMKNSDLEIGIIELQNPEAFDYQAEYAIQLFDNMICIEAAWHDKNEHSDEGFYNFDNDMVLVDGDVHYSIIDHCDPDKLFEIVLLDEDAIDDDEEEDADERKEYDCCKCHTHYTEIPDDVVELLARYINHLFW